MIQFQRHLVHPELVPTTHRPLRATLLIRNITFVGSSLDLSPLNTCSQWFPSLTHLWIRAEEHTNSQLVPVYKTWLGLPFTRRTVMKRMKTHKHRETTRSELFGVRCVCVSPLKCAFDRINVNVRAYCLRCCPFCYRANIFFFAYVGCCSSLCHASWTYGGKVPSSPPSCSGVEISRSLSSCEYVQR